MTKLRIGTRTSTLAMWQANRVEAIINNMGIETEIVGINSSGDKSLGGDLASSVGQFIHAVDAELISGSIDIAVHSSKDVPVTISDELTNLAYLERGYTNDVIIFRDSNGYHNLSDLLANRDESTIDQALAVVPKSGMVGTVSGRRQSFVLSKRPDIIPIAVRGQVETRLKRLQEGRVDAIILAEVGLQRLHQVGALEPWVLSMGAMRINDIDWPTAPGQGAISVHCRMGDLDNFADLRVALNHLPTESDVINERKILSAIGGGCLYPAGIKVAGDTVAAQISPKNWREIFCQGLPYDSQRYTGSLSDYQPVLPTTSIEPRELNKSGPKIISTLNSERLERILKNNTINVINQPVIELVAKPENWPTSFLNDNTPRANWPYLVLTSPFAARCAVEVAEHNPDLKRIQWLAIGEGTARACFMRGVTVSICAQARNSVELVDYINRMISRDITLMIPRSDVASSDLVDRLNALGFSTKSWIGYENRTKQIPAMPVSDDDVLLLSSPSSARAWVENSLPIPKNILCMGKSSLAEIDSLGYFTDSTVEILQGPTSEFVAKWWKENRGD